MRLADGIIHDLVRAIEAKDLSTAAHTWRVVMYLRAVLEDRGAEHELIEQATIGAALHDVGKIDIPSSILQKPAKLTEPEFAVIQQHPVTGYARMIHLGVDDETVLDLIRYHHEHWDGTGYPFNLTGDRIPEIARLFAVIDTFDALTSLRPYRKTVGEAAAMKALDILEDGRGTRYWPEAVDTFAELYRSGRVGHILTYFNDEAALPVFPAPPGDDTDALLAAARRAG